MIFQYDAKRMSYICFCDFENDSKKKNTDSLLLLLLLLLLPMTGSAACYRFGMSSADQRTDDKVLGAAAQRQAMFRGGVESAGEGI